MMFGVGTATRVYLALGATDMRKGFEGLHGLVRQRLELDPLSGHLFLFCNRSRTRLKVLFWDGSGLWVCAKRLEKGRFSWPQVSGPTAKAAIAMPSIRQNGSPSINMRSAYVPESPSSALQTMYFCAATTPKTVFHLMPVGNAAPPRPRKPESNTACTMSDGAIANACCKPR